VQLLRTYPNLRHGRNYPFAHGGERSVARGYTKALARARRLVYVEDQYLWGRHVGDLFAEALLDNLDLHVIAVVPMHPDLSGAFSRTPQLLGRRRAMLPMVQAAPDRVAFYGIENEQGTPVYVHAKTCIIDDTWASIGSDNFNRRSWTHDSELSAAVVDLAAPGSGAQLGYAQRLRLSLAMEHLGRRSGVRQEPNDDRLLEVMSDCVDPAGMFDTLRQSAAGLDTWYADGCRGPRPTGRLRRMDPPVLGRLARNLALPTYRLLHDPDGRPRTLRRQDRF
jgi:phosphatidylserine/phosphatidylglycerophosphate/cardiolipin synthase-like enzyme